MIEYAEPMRTMSLTELRRDLAQTIDSVNADRRPVRVTVGSGKPAVILMSFEDVKSLEETAYLLRSPRNAERSLQSIDDLERGSGAERKLLE